MRPFEHYGLLGQSSLDFYIHSVNEELYNELSDRGEKLIENKRLEFLGEFKEKPLRTFKELTSKIEEQERKLKKLKELNAPAEILNYEKEILESLKQKLDKKEFIKFNDKESQQYKKIYDDLNLSFKRSNEYKNVLKEIYAYNDSAISSFVNLDDEELDKDFIDWLNS